MHQMPGQAKAQIKDFVPPPPLPLKRKHPQGNKVQDDDLGFQQALDSLQEVCQVQLGLAMQPMQATQRMHASTIGIDR
jgi:hypothetical protein